MRALAPLIIVCWGLMSGCAGVPFLGSAFGSLSSGALLETAAVNGVSYVTTGKGVSEHVISGVADQDCKFFNVIDGKNICQDYAVSKVPQKDITTRFSSAAPTTVEDVIALHQ